METYSSTQISCREIHNNQKNVPGSRHGEASPLEIRKRLRVLHCDRADSSWWSLLLASTVHE